MVILTVKSVRRVDLTAKSLKSDSDSEIISEEGDSDSTISECDSNSEMSEKGDFDSEINTEGVLKEV